MENTSGKFEKGVPKGLSQKEGKETAIFQGGSAGDLD